MDEDGVLTVRAEDRASGQRGEVTIRASDTGRLPPAEIERMQRDGELHRERDAARRQSLAARNALETLAHAAKRKGSKGAAAVLDWIDAHPDATAAAYEAKKGEL